MRSCKSSCQTHTQFHDFIPNFANFANTLKLGMKHGVEGKTGAQSQGNYMNNSKSSFRTI
jgi:hypothetical protein